MFKQIFSFLLCVVLTISLVPGAVVAADTSGGNGSFVSETHDVFQHTESTLAPGVEQYTNYAYAKDGKQMVYYVATADISRDDVVAGVNASFYNMTTGQPMGITYIDGVSFGTSSYDNFFAILKDGKTAVIDYAKNIGNYVDADGNSTIWQAAAGSQWLVRDGKDVTAGAASNTGFVNPYQEPGWHYLSIDLSAYKGLYLHRGYIVQFYISDRDGADYDYYFNQHKSYNGRYVMYVDDITVDYSDAVEDRDAPVFGDVTYASTSMSDAAVLNGQTVADNTLSFSTKAADHPDKSNDTGLDAATAKAYIDGVETACGFKDGIMSVSDAVLADGVHHVKFSICDRQGNYASVIRTINVQANSGLPTVKVAAHDPSLDKIKLGSVWYADVVATDMQQVQSVVVDIDLNNMSRWELDHMRVAPGFTATYTVQDDENIATIVITRTGKNDTVGEGTLVSMPIRTWELKTGYTYESGTKNGKPAFTYKQVRDMKEFWPVDISMEIDRGLVTFVDGTTDTFSGEGPQVDTESYKMAKDMISTVEGKAYYDAWDGGHIHTAAALPDQAATCTEDGYTGRTYCESCNFVVNWGTAIPAGTYLFGEDGVLVGPGDAAVVASGSCGENATWTLYDSGKLEIGGTGAVSDYESQLVTPWVGYRDQIKSIEIGAGITSIGRYACTSITFAEGSKLEKIEVTGFYYDFQVTSVVLPETVRSIGVLAFGNMYGLTDLYVPQGVSMIGDNAFRGSRQVTLSVAAGSYAELYAVNQNIAHISRDK